MATRVDLKGIKDTIKSILDTANTTTASPIDLSSNLANSKRVQKVLSIHPDMIQPQPSFFPLVTSYIEDKGIEAVDISKDQLNANRKATVSINVVGAVWNNNLSSDLEDPADNDINYLMENVELILRGNSNLDSKVTWQFPNGTKFYNTVLDEQTHLRSGILNVVCTVYY